MYNTNQIKLVEELTQEQLDTLKSLVFWNDTKMADYNNITQDEQQQIDNALFEADISNNIIYKLYEFIYFTDAGIEKLANKVVA